MGYRKGFDKGKRRVVVEGNEEPSGDLNSLLNVIFSERERHRNQEARRRKNKKRNQQRSER